MFRQRLPWSGQCSPCFPMATGVSLLGILSALYLCASLTLIAGGTVGPWMLPVIMASVIAVQFMTLPLKRAIKVAGLTAGMVALSLLVNLWAEDFSYDGNEYHLEAVMRMATGWNPFHDNPAETGSDKLWIFHYCIGIEIIEAAVLSATGWLQGAKCVNLVLIGATAMIVYGSLAKLTSGRRGVLLAITAVITLNPVGLTQVFTYYFDYTKYYYMVLTLVAACGIARGGGTRIWWSVMMTMVSILAIATKFNIAFEQGLLMVLVATYFLVKRQKVAAGTVIASGVIAMTAGLALCYHPYVTNLLEHGHPLYPLMGNNALDIMTYNLPDELIGKGRISSFFISLFTIKPPIYDSRLGGFGVLMPVLLAMAVVGIVRYRRQLPQPVLLVAVYAFVSCFIFEQSWWARYQCQLWLVVAVASLYPLYTPPAKRHRLLTAFLVLTILNAALALGRSAIYIACNWRWHKVVFETAGTDTVEFYPAAPQVERQLRDLGFSRIRGLKDIPHDNSVNWYISHDMTVLRLTPAHLDSLKKEVSRRNINFNRFDHDIQQK